MPTTELLDNTSGSSPVLAYSFLLKVIIIKRTLIYFAFYIPDLRIAA
jgi:hypothetical protein